MLNFTVDIYMNLKTKKSFRSIGNEVE